MVVLAARSVTLEGGGEGLRFYLLPDLDRAKEMAHPLTEQSRPEILHRSQEHLH